MQYFIRLENETLEEAMASDGYKSVKDAIIDARVQLPPGELFQILDADLQYACIFSGMVPHSATWHLDLEEVELVS